MTVDTAARKVQLDDMLAELDRTLATLQVDENEDEEAETDGADAAAALSGTEQTGLVVAANQEQRDQVVAALERVAEGTYGRCVDCGKDIPEGRLEAKPEAARDVECQAKADADA